jgi:hypothetical protein
MSKQPHIERFVLTMRQEVEAQEMGLHVANLTRLGYTDVKFELITDIKTFNRRNKPEIRTKDFLMTWMQQHPSFKAIDAVKALRDDGRGNGTAAYPALGELVEKGILKKVDAGMYARADVKAIAGPKKNAKKAEKAKPRIKHEVSNTDFILRAASRAHGRFNSLSIKKLFEASGRPSTSVGPCITKLRNDGMIKPLGEGRYELTDLARRNKPAPQLNGGAIETPAEAVTNA